MEEWELSMSNKNETFKIDVHSHSYSRLYFIERTNLTYQQTCTLMKDPELIDGLKKLGIEWAWKMQGHDFIVRLFNKSEMNMVNRFLDKFAGEYKAREPKILNGTPTSSR